MSAFGLITIKDVFNNHLKVMKIFTKGVYILCRNREDLCSCFWTCFLCFSKCVAAPRCISMFRKERATASERYQWTAASERKCAADIFLCVAASRNISMFFNERAAASEKILTTASEIYLLKEKNVLLRIMSTLRNILKWKHDGNIFFISEVRYFYVILVELLW